jgi:2,5-furandicarboxylate decarboxylase 1
MTVNATTTSTATLDLDRFRLRNFVEQLGPEELEIREEKVDLADVAAILQNNPKAVLFKNAGPEGQQLVGNVVGSRSRLAKAFGVPVADVALEMRRRLSLKPELVKLSKDEAPVQQVVKTGTDSSRPVRTPIFCRCRCMSSMRSTVLPTFPRPSTTRSIRRTGVIIAACAA